MEVHIDNEARAEFLEGNKTGVLVIHGFTGSTQSMREVAYALHKEEGYTISLPRLKGHGTTPEDMESTSYEDWIKSVTDAYEEIRPKVDNLFVFGLSLGGALTLLLAENYPIKGIITVNAAIELANFLALYNDPNIPPFLQGIGSDIKKEGIKEWAYDRTPKKSIGEAACFLELVKANLSKVTCPALIFKSLDDHVVPPTNQDYILEHINSSQKELIELLESYHVATLDNDKELIIEKTIQFIKSNM